MCDLVAQWSTRWTSNPKIAGSNPVEVIYKKFQNKVDA
jgi:hypothetical protein